MSTNPLCAHLGIPVPDLRDHVGRDKVPFRQLLIVALLAHGGPMTLEAVAAAIAAAGGPAADDALRSLKRCRPGSTPLYREGDLYAVDVVNGLHELELLLFLLGLRPPRDPPPPPPPPPPAPPPGPDQPLRPEELDAAWRGATLSAWSRRRTVVAVLDAVGRPLTFDELSAEVKARTGQGLHFDRDHQLDRRGSPVVEVGEGRWALAPDAGREIRRAREEVRAMAAKPRAQLVFSSAAYAAFEEREALLDHADDRLRRLVLRAAPGSPPAAVCVADLQARTLRTFQGEALAQLPALLEAADEVIGVDPRATLRAIGVDPTRWRLKDLSTTPKSVTVDELGGSFRVVLDQVIGGTLGWGVHLSTPTELRSLGARRGPEVLRRCMEEEVRALAALYAYGRLQGEVLVAVADCLVPLWAPWADGPGRRLHHHAEAALKLGADLEVVRGEAPALERPWQWVERIKVRPGPPDGYPRFLLFDLRGNPVERRDIFAVRVAGPA